MLAVHAGLLAWSALRQSPTVDEPVHLAAGIRNWQSGRFDLNRGNPPLVGMIAACPVLLAKPETDWRRAPNSHDVGSDLLAVNGSRSFWLTTLGRWALIPFSLLGGYICFRWATELYGYGSGLLALALWCFDPNVIAHGQLITGDVPATALGILAFYLFWKWLYEPSAGRALLAGLVLGATELTKYVWVILYVLWPVLWIAWRFVDRRRSERLSFVRELGHGVLIVLVSGYVINLGYGFDRPFQRLDHFHVGRNVLARLESLLPAGDQATGPGDAGWVTSLPMPLPEPYVDGIGEISHRIETRPWTYLRTQWRPGGWWYYYPYALLVKLPLSTLALVALACILSVLPRFPSDWKTELFLLIPIAVMLVFVTHCGSVQRLRYALPIFPFVFILAGKAGRVFAENDRLVAMLVSVCLGWSAASSLIVYPHSGSYFNELVGGPRHGHEQLIESNIEWGQDLLYLKQWLNRHPEARPLHLAYFGRIDPRSAGIEFTLPPKLLRRGYGGERIPFRKQGPQPGWHAVSVNLLRGHGWAVHDGQGSTRWLDGTEYHYLLYSRPVATAGYSIYVYHITVDEANRVRRELGLPELPASSRRHHKAPGPLPARGRSAGEPDPALALAWAW